MNATHTPGPWTNEGSIVGADRTVIAYRVNRPSGGSKAVEDANAKLIAAAPDLLAACKALLWQHDNNNGVLCGMALQDARAAIARAVG